MATFSVNQVRHLYVANEVGTENTLVTAKDKVGKIAAMQPKDNSTLTFSYRSPGGVVRSDLIDLKKVISVSYTEAGKMAHKLKAKVIKLNPEVNSGNLVSGQDYLIRVAIRQYMGMSDEDQYFKHGVVHAYSGMEPKKFYVKLAKSLAINFSRELTPIVNIYVTDGSTDTPVTSSTKESDLSGEYTGVVIEEAEQDWVLGTMPVTHVDFEVFTQTIEFEHSDLLWGVIKDHDSKKSLNNGKLIADLEHFCMGDRGDFYRGIGYPNVIRTQYLVDPSKGYDVIDIHYYSDDEGVHPQKSEKTLTIVGEASAMGTLKTLIESVIKSIANDRVVYL